MDFETSFIIVLIVLVVVIITTFMLITIYVNSLNQQALQQTFGMQ